MELDSRYNLFWGTDIYLRLSVTGIVVLGTLVSWIEVPVCFIQDFCYFKRERQFGLFSFEITKVLNKTLVMSRIPELGNQLED